MRKDTKNGNAEQSEMGLSLEELIRRGARELIQKAIEVELRELLGDYENVMMLGGQRAVLRLSLIHISCRSIRQCTRETRLPARITSFLKSRPTVTVGLSDPTSRVLRLWRSLR